MSTCISDDALAAWVDGRLPTEQVSAMSAHLAGCTTCRVVVSELARTTEDRPAPLTLGRYVLSAPEAWASSTPRGIRSLGARSR